MKTLTLAVLLGAAALGAADKKNVLLIAGRPSHGPGEHEHNAGIQLLAAGLKQGADGSLEIYIQNENPGPDKASNWLPAPKGPFFFVARFYGPQAPLIDGSWKLPPLVEAK